MFFIPLFKKKLKKNEFTHIIITHFNLDYSYVRNDVKKDLYKDTDWLSKRFDLFEKYCYPSIQQQTNKNFIWVCTFHKNTPEPFMSKIKEYEKNCSQLIVTYADEYEAYAKIVNNLIKSITPKVPYLVTTRLDNDDSIAIDYVDEIQKRLYKHDRYFIDFWYGYTYDEKNKTPYYIKTRRNPFSTCVEKWENAKTIKQFPHICINKYGPIYSIKTKPMWAQIVHGGNILNKIDGDKNEKLSDFKERFVFAKY